MKNLKFAFVLMIAFLTLSCSKDAIETAGRVIISFDNQSLYNQDDYYVTAGIVFQESDSGLLIDLGTKDISNGGSVAFEPIELNIGNYYVRYQYTTGGGHHKPFQIKGGEETFVGIIK